MKLRSAGLPVVTRIAVISGYILVSLAHPLAAGDSLWKKGSTLLNSIGVGTQTEGLTLEEIGAGLKEALGVGSQNVVSRLGRLDGFNQDPSVHIPLPKELDKVRSVLDPIGMSGLLDDLELKINRAAEAATPKATELFKQAITEMQFEDVKAILDGPEDAATQYFRGKMAPALAKEMKPIVDQSLLQVGAIKAYDDTIQQYKSVPFVPDVTTDLSNHVVDKGIDGIFYYMAQEEAAIRSDPAKQTTALLKRVFGQ